MWNAQVNHNNAKYSRNHDKINWPYRRYIRTRAHIRICTIYTCGLRLPDHRCTQLKKDRPKSPIFGYGIIFFSPICIVHFWINNNRPLYELKQDCNFILFHSTLTVAIRTPIGCKKKSIARWYTRICHNWPRH